MYHPVDPYDLPSIVCDKMARKGLKCKGRTMSNPLKFGLFGVNQEVCSEPTTAARIAQAAEAAGFESLWAGEHIVLPDPPVSSAPFNPTLRLLDPVVALTFLAAHTQKALLATGIIILPQRNPLVLAKELASLDTLSNGRLLFGMGVGYLEAEFRALGASFHDRGARADEYLAAIRAIWTQEQPTYHGRFVSFEHVQAYPHPNREVPVVVGGQSPSALRLLLAMAMVGMAIASILREQLSYLLNCAMPANKCLGPLEISVTPRGQINRAIAERYATLGVHRLVLLPPANATPSVLEDFVGIVGSTLIGQV